MDAAVSESSQCSRTVDGKTSSMEISHNITKIVRIWIIAIRNNLRLDDCHYTVKNVNSRTMEITTLVSYISIKIG